MTLSASPYSDENTAFHLTKSENGSKASDSGTKQEAHPERLSTMVLSDRPQAASPEHFSGCGTLQRQQPCSTTCSIQGRFLIQTNGSQGQTIMSVDGTTICWTTNSWVAQVLVKLLNDNEGLLG